MSHSIRMNAEQTASLIDRFLQDRSLYPQEWNDFVECPQKDPAIEIVRRRCDELDPHVNNPAPKDEQGVQELKQIIVELRRPAAVCRFL